MEPNQDEIDAELTRLQVLAESTPEDLAEMTAIRTQIEAGTYDPPTKEVARTIVDVLRRKRRDGRLTAEEQLFIDELDLRVREIVRSRRLRGK